MRFLVFRLYAPLCSFGDVAVGELRPSLSAPTRSMILGLLSACLGIPRHDEVGQAEIERSIGVATRTDAPGALLVDFHTAQAPGELGIRTFIKREGRPMETRREELEASVDKDGNRRRPDTQISQRQYRVDAAFAVCVWLRVDDVRYSIETLADHLRCPVYTPFAGRKSAVIGLPFEPTLIEASDPVSALRDARFSLDDTIEKLILSKSAQRTYRWESDMTRWPDVRHHRIEVRRDRIASRARWQFLTREEHVHIETKEPADVPQHP